jgi:O-antigen/teichoic acid export membrane protein
VVEIYNRFGEDYFVQREKEVIEEVITSYGLVVLSTGSNSFINHYLHAKDQFSTIFWINVLGLCFGVVAAIFAIPHYGLIGACWSWGIGLSASMLGYVVYFLKHTKNA